MKYFVAVVLLAAGCAAELPSSYGAPPPTYHPPQPTYGAPQPQYGVPTHETFHAPRQEITEVTKDVYVHIPPPDAPEEFEGGFQKPVVNRKHYKIIFIKAPSVSIEQMTKFQQQGQQEEKTIVYVLVKKPELNTGIDLEKNNKSKSHKPEVYFIKYKAQKESKAQFDSTGPYPASGHPY